ncbi:MAG: hypothetical protein ACOX7Q_04730 [Kiritimatiellia bacterium]
MKLKFTKMHGAGNDFVLIDDRDGHVPWEDHLLMAALASRRTGIGCEGVISGPALGQGRFPHALSESGRDGSGDVR